MDKKVQTLWQCMEFWQWFLPSLQSKGGQPSAEKSAGSLGEERSGDLFEEVRERQGETVREKEERHLYVLLFNSYWEDLCERERG